MRQGQWKYTIIAYDGLGRKANRIYETVHRDKTSKDIELEAWRQRIKRHEVPSLRVISHVYPFWQETVVDEHTLEKAIELE